MSQRNGFARQDGRLKVVVIGGGLVGSLSACYFANRGHDVTLYEYREDIRHAQLVKGRSINLSLSVRGIKALRQVGMDKLATENAIPMRGRMIHPRKGAKYEMPYDTVSNNCIFSVGRKYLNEILLSAAEKFPNVKTIFQHKLVGADLQKGSVTLLRTETNEIVKEEADLIVGADGAYSSLRREFMKQPNFDFSQKYIEHGYIELCIPPTADGDYAMEPNFLHIWPRGTFMMIALPNLDKSWTISLFMPFSQFDYLNTPDKLLTFFQQNFPDSIELFGEDRLVRDYFSTKPSNLVSIKCFPYHVGTKAVLLGDAAHAMVPFYGQGMNAGFEDCRILDDLILQFPNNLSKVLQSYSEYRNPDAEAICDLALYNYTEMRDLVSKKSFLIRKKLDNALYFYFPKLWLPLYNSVTFSDMRYSECIKNKQWQDKLLLKMLKLVGLGSAGFVTYMFYTQIFLNNSFMSETFSTLTHL